MKLLAPVLALALVLPVAAGTITVGPDADYEEIQSALDAASPGDVVSVAAGYYALPDGVEIERDNVTLKGAGADQTVLDGKDKAYAVVEVSATGAVVTGFTIRGGSSHGLYLNESATASIHHNVITANGDRGILLASGTPAATVDHNTFANNSVSAVYSYRDEPRTKFTNNIFYNNSRSLVTDKDEGGMTVRYNCFYGHSNDDQWVPKHKSNIEADPDFVDGEADFHLSGGSPCLGAGKDDTDIGALGTGRNQAAVTPADDEPATGRYNVVVFANDQALGRKVVAVLKAAGFAADKSHVNEGPNDDANIKYGAADAADVRTMRKLVNALYDGKIVELDEFDEDDYDVYINLP